MPKIEFTDFRGGLDLRRDVAMSASNVLAVLRNCYVGKDGKIYKRPGLSLAATLESGTVGLRAAGGKLNTFYTQASNITHASTLMRANRVNHPSVATDIAAVHYGANFNGYLYCAIEYANGDTKHHYLDDPGAWVALTNYALGDFRRPTTANGYRYEVTADAGSAAAGEPVWPTTIGATVVDGGITWTCRSFAVVDTNCPHSKSVKKIGQKLYAIDGDTVPFCAASLPRDWTTASDAGFLPVGINANGSDTAVALGVFNRDLVVFFADSLQTWNVDPDPTLNDIKDSIDNVGTVHRNSIGNTGNDLLFLGKQGYRSLSVVTLTDNLQENDIGSPVDSVRDDIADTDDIKAVYFPALGQLWFINGATVYVYAFSKTNKLSAWSIFDYPFSIDAADVLNNELYLRSGDLVYQVDKAQEADDGVLITAEVEMFYQDGKAPGDLKQFTAFEGVFRGDWEIAWKYDPRDTDLATDYVAISGDMRPGDLFPMELCATSVAPIFRHASVESASIQSLLCYYEKLGAV